MRGDVQASSIRLRLLPSIAHRRWFSPFGRDERRIKEQRLERIERLAKVEREARWLRWL
jgi:hypothetical protein